MAGNFSLSGVRVARAAITFFLAIAIGMPAIGTSPALAQSRDGPPTLFQWLFGPKEPARRASPAQRRQQNSSQRPRNRASETKRVKRNQQTPSIVRNRTAAPAPVAKLENAKTVLVVGDFLASNLGDGLTARFATSAGITIQTKANGSSGLVRKDYYDWASQLPNFVTEFKPAMSIIMIGANDRQIIDVNGQELRFGTEAWFAEYERRLTTMADQAKANGAKLAWVGLPAFSSSNFTADALILNRMYRNVVEKAGGEFIDVWDGFTDEAGKFITTGFDVNGQQARLREADGIGITPAGREKLAFYVERVIRRYIDDASADGLKLDGSNLPALTSLPNMGVNASEIRTQPINITDPELDGGKALLGGDTIPVANTVTIIETPRQRLINRGEMDEAPLGRIDDYRPNAGSGQTASIQP